MSDGVDIVIDGSGYGRGLRNRTCTRIWVRSRGLWRYLDVVYFARPTRNKGT